VHRTRRADCLEYEVEKEFGKTITRFARQTIMQLPPVSAIIVE